MKHQLLTMAVAMLSLAACTSEDNVGQDPLKDTPIKLNVTVDEPISRAGYSNEVLPDSFCLTVVHDMNNDKDKYNYSAVVKRDGESWKMFDGSEYIDHFTEKPITMLWANMTDKVMVQATSEVYGIAIQGKTDQSTPEKLKEADILFAEDNDATPSMNGIDVNFKHIKSKIHLTIELGDEYEYADDIDEKITDVKVDGTKTEGNTNIDDNGVIHFINLSNAAPITPLLTSTTPYKKEGGVITKAKATYEVILVPQTIAADGFSISFSVDNKTYKWTYGSELTLASGTAYTLKLTAGDDKVQPVSFEAAPWGTGNGTEGNEGENKETD